MSDTTKTVTDHQIVIQIQIGNMFPLTSLTHLHRALVQEQQSERRALDPAPETRWRASARRFPFGQSRGSGTEVGGFGMERQP